MIARYATRVNGLTDFFLTKLDVLNGLGADPGLRGVRDRRHARRGAADDPVGVPPRQADLREPRRAGSEDISQPQSFDDLPKNAQDYVSALEEMSGAPISAIGVGPGREQTVVLRDSSAV